MCFLDCWSQEVKATATIEGGKTIMQSQTPLALVLQCCNMKARTEVKNIDCSNSFIWILEINQMNFINHKFATRDFTTCTGRKHIIHHSLEGTNSQKGRESEEPEGQRSRSSPIQNEALTARRRREVPARLLVHHSQSGQRTEREAHSWWLHVGTKDEVSGSGLSH